MSYDLHFTSRVVYARAQVKAWLANLPNAFDLDERVGFENDATGVDFGFDFYGDDPLPAFSINYLRPHVFALEAEPVLAAFVARFGLEVSDPQMDGMGDGPYSREGFLRGWSAGNRFGYEMLVDDGHDAQRFALPGEKNRIAWEWNLHRARLDAALRTRAEWADVVIPDAVHVVDEFDDVYTMVDWDGPGPLVWPPGVDRVALGCDEARWSLVPSASFAAEDVWPPGTPVVDDLAFSFMVQRSLGLRDGEARDADLVELTRLAPAEVLDLELLEEVRRRRRPSASHPR